MGRLEGKAAIVTCAAQGAGAVMAAQLAEHGAPVVATDVLDSGACIDEIKAAGGSAIGIQADVTSNDDLAKGVATAKAAFGGVDILVHNASIFVFVFASPKPKPFMQIDEEEYH